MITDMVIEIILAVVLLSVAAFVKFAVNQIVHWLTPTISTSKQKQLFKRLVYLLRNKFDWRIENLVSYNVSSEFVILRHYDIKNLLLQFLESDFRSLYSAKIIIGEECISLDRETTYLTFRQQKQLKRHMQRLYQSLQAKNTTDKHKQIFNWLRSCCDVEK